MLYFLCEKKWLKLNRIKLKKLYNLIIYKFNFILSELKEKNKFINDRTLFIIKMQFKNIHQKIKKFDQFFPILIKNFKF